MQSDRQVDKQTDRLADKQMDRHTDGTKINLNRQTDRHTKPERHTDT